MSGSGECDGILLIGFGGPTRHDQIRPFLDNVLRGRPVPPERYEEVVRHYEMMGGRSPYNELTMLQAGALREMLERQGVRAPIAVGMRNWEPYLDQAMTTLGRAGAKRVLGFVLAAHRCEASWERYQQNVRDAQQKLGESTPAVEYPEPWHAHPRFVAANVARVRESLAGLSADERGRVHLIFTAHSIPVSMAAKSPYVEQLTESSRLVANVLGLSSWSLAFQSRSGSPRDPWLEPDIKTALSKLHREAIAVVVPIGFLCDHVEVLYDLDVDAAALARDSGIRFVRAPTVGDHPEFIAMMAEVARAHLRG